MPVPGWRERQVRAKTLGEALQRWNSGMELVAAQVGEVEALPTSYLYDPAGKLVSYQQGMVTKASVESYIKSKSKKK